MEVAGNTIVIRKKAVIASGKEAPASAEVKVKIPAIPKAPKVKIDYVKGTINFGKGTQYIKSAAITDTPPFLTSVPGVVSAFSKFSITFSASCYDHS